MSELIRVPDLGGEGEVIELLVKVGDRVEAEQSILTLESDKASMEVPVPKAGIIKVGGHLLKPGGHLLAMKGVRPDEEIIALPAGWTVAATHALSVPGLVGERHLVIVNRDA